MALKHKKRTSVIKTLFFLFAGLAALGFVIAEFLKGQNIALVHSKGAIAAAQRDLMLYSLIIMCSIAIPTVLLLYYMAWKYRESNHKKTYQPSAKRGKFFTFTIWALPALFISFLAILLVPATHKLEPHKAIASDKKPLTVQVIAMQWKWVFIYPEQQIATVNYLQIPEDTPVVLELTADEAPMSSFWVPNLAGMLYTMTGHVHRLNIIADEQGSYPGRSGEINGKGFEGMKFMTRVTSQKDFDSWAQDVRSTSTPLDKKAYDELLKPTENHQITMHVVYDDTHFARALMKYSDSHAGGHDDAAEKNKKTDEHAAVIKHEDHN